MPLDSAGFIEIATSWRPYCYWATKATLRLTFPLQQNLVGSLQVPKPQTQIQDSCSVPSPDRTTISPGSSVNMQLAQAFPRRPASRSHLLYRPPFVRLHVSHGSVFTLRAFITFLALPVLQRPVDSVLGLFISAG